MLQHHGADLVSGVSLVGNQYPRHRQIPRREVGASEVAALSFAQMEADRPACAVAYHVQLAGQSPLGATDQTRAAAPFSGLDAVRCALTVVASTISTASGIAPASDTLSVDCDNSEKITRNTPVSHQRRQRL